MKKSLLLLVYIVLSTPFVLFSQGDACSVAPAIPQTCTWYTGNNTGFTTGSDDTYAPGDICALSLENSAWYTFTPTVTANYDIIFSNLSCSGGGAMIQAGILQLTGGVACTSSATYTSLGCATTASYPCFEIGSIPLTAGVTYYIVCDGDAGASCTWNINVCYSTCTTPPDVGTFVIDYNGTPIAGPPYSPIYLCAEGGGDCYGMTSNNDYSLPPPWGCEVSELMWLLYTGPPTGPDPALDPNYSGSLWTGQDFTDCNPSTYGLTGTWYWVPVTADDGDDGGDPNGVVHWDQNGDGCYDLGINETVQVTYLNAIAVSTSSNPCTGTVTVTVTGGMPEFAGGNYTVTNNGMGSLAGLPVTHNGSFQITGLNNGDGWSVTITDPNGCSNTFTGTYTGDASSPSWTNPSPICAAAGPINLNTLITGTAGGTWSGTGVSGNTFNPAFGTQTVTYSVGPCPKTLAQTITVIPDVDPSWTNPSPICAAAGPINLNSLITGTTGGTWSGTGVSGNTFDPSFGTQTVTYTVGTAPCQESSALTITVNPDVDPTLNPTSQTVCEAAGLVDLTTFEAGTTGGTWSGTGVTGTNFDPTGLSGPYTLTYTVGTAPCQESASLTITVNPDVDPTLNPTSQTVCEAAGLVDLTTFEAGTTGGTWSGTGVTGTNFDPTGLSGPYTLTYTVGTAPCQESATLTITVNPDVDPTLNPTSISVCENSGLLDLTTFEAGTTGGTWSGTGVTGTNFDPSGQSGAIVLTYTVGTAPCEETSNLTVTVDPVDIPTFTYPSSTFCVTGTNPVATITGTTGGTFSASAPGVLANTATGEIDLAASGVGSFWVYYNTSSAGNPCPAIDSVQITITTSPSAAFTYDNNTYCQSDPNPIITFGPGASAGTFTANPAGLTLNSSNGNITLSSSIAGTYWVYNNIAASGGCAAAVDSFQITVNADDDPSFNYPSSTFCITGTNPVATITGTTGGTFSASAPGVLANTATGEIDLTASGLGSFWVYYNTASAGNPCPAIDSVQITITNAPSAAFTYDNTAYCQGGPNPVITITGSAGVFSSNPGGLTLNASTGAITLSSSTPGTYWVYNDIAAAGGCAAERDSFQLTINPEDTAVFTYNGPYCITGTNPTATITGTTGGTFTISSPGVLANSATGEIDLAASGVGTFWVYYNTASAGNPCPNIDSVQVSIVTAPSASFTYSGSPYCQGDTATILPVFGPNEYAGTFSSNPAGVVFVSTSTGQIDLVNSTPGTYWIINNLTPGGGCASDVDSFQVTINPMFVNAQAASICQGDSILLGGSYQTSSGVYADTLSTVNGCDSIINTTLTVNPTGNSTNNVSICQGDSVFAGGGYQTSAGTYYDTLSTSLGCDSIVSTVVTVTPQPNALSINDTTVCLSDGIPTLTVNGSGGTITWYSDSTGTTTVGTGSSYTPTITATGSYTYYVQESNGNCFGPITSVTVTVGGPTAVISTNPNPPTGAIPFAVDFNDVGTGGTSWNWDFGDGNTSNTQTSNNTYTTTGTYTVVLTVSDGICFAYDTITVDVFGESFIIIPNVFSPNNDGINDVFIVTSNNLESLQGEIWNRWGQLMYKWDGINGFWDGRTTAGEESPEGTYFFIIKAKGLDGTEYEEKGSFTLVR
ncbi:MAG: hypothetical protein Kow0079_04470 [Vicingaceae bacterium]